MELYCIINGERYEIVSGSTFSEEYNETLDSGVIIIDQVSRIDNLEPYDDVYIYDDVEEGQQHTFYKHLLVDSFQEQLQNVKDKFYKYKINLFSETKKLDKILLPNISITQPLDKTKRRSVWEYLNIYVNLYSPEIKVVDSEEEKTWKYEKKYSISATKVLENGTVVDSDIKTLFDSVDAPEMSLTNPTLRDVLSQLMLVKDCIPVVHDDIIDFIDITKRNDDFSTDYNVVNYIHSSMNSSEYSTDARREYSGAISQDNSARMIEKIGFRNGGTGVVKNSDLSVETRFPIYKINRMYMCYYKTVQLTQTDEEKVFLCKQDITSLIMQSNVRNSLSKDYYEFEKDIENPHNIGIDFLQKYRWSTLGYSIGSNQIIGWGEMYEHPTNLDLPWFETKSTVLQNLICFFDAKFPVGVNGLRNAINNPNVIGIKDITAGSVSDLKNGEIIRTGDKFTGVNTIKSVFFEIDYNAMFSGALIHSKDFKEKDDLATADNCSSSLVLLEADGLFEKEKMNRLGNRQYNIQARYENENGASGYYKMNNVYNHILGSVYDDDIIIYHREYSIFNDFVLANFAGTQDYVLKNYFTSVFAKLRTYNLASYEESVSRAENYKEYIVLSKGKAIFEDGTILRPYLDKYISCFSETNVPKSYKSYNFEDSVNFAFLEMNGKKSFSDVNVFCSGSSMCVNLKMYDNVTEGVQIKSPEIDLEDDEEQIVGMTQKWSLAIKNPQDAFQEKINFGFGHMYNINDQIPSGKKIMFPELGQQLSDSEISDFYDKKLFLLPSFSDNDYIGDSAKYCISFGQNGKNICKDNKEAIDYTFQFESISNDKNVIFSPWFVKLSDMSGAFPKFYKNYRVNYFSPLVKLSKITPFTAVEPNTTPNTKPMIRFRISKDSYILSDNQLYYRNELPSFLIFNYFVNNHPEYDTTVFLDSFESVYVYENGDLQLSFKYSYITGSHEKASGFTLTCETVNEDENYWYLEGIFRSVLPNYNTKTEEHPSIYDYNIKCRYFPLEEEQKVEYTKNMFAIVSEKEIKKELVYDSMIAIKEDEFELTHPKLDGFEGTFNINFISDGEEFVGIEVGLQGLFYIRPDGSIGARTITAYIDDGSPTSPRWEKEEYSKIKIIGGEDVESDEFVNWFEETIGRRMYSSKSKIRIEDLPSYMHIVNTDDENFEYTSEAYIPFNDLFVFGYEKGAPCIYVGRNMLSNYPEHQSIQFWYLDNNGEGGGKLQFVFGLNTTEHQNMVFASVCKKRSPYVYSKDHGEVVGEILKMEEDTSTYWYYEENLYDEKNDTKINVRNFKKRRF